MKKFGFLLVFLLVSPPVRALHVVVDAGHGGVDKGAVRNGMKEADLALKVAKSLEGLLINDPAFKVSLTRSGPKGLRLKERTELANELGADLFLSIHLNASMDPRAKGGEVYFQNQLEASAESRFLANRESHHKLSSQKSNSWPLKRVPDAGRLKPEVIQIIKDLQRNHRIYLSSQLSQSLVENWLGRKPARKRPIRQAPFYVITNVNMPSVLVELGYLSHPREARQLASSSYQNKLAMGIYRGLLQYKDSMDKGSTSRLYTQEK